jgi:hypothetical protein
VTAGEGSIESTSADPVGEPVDPTVVGPVDATVAERVDATAQARLEQLAARPLAEHADGYEQLHGELRAALAEIDDA